ncbi:SseB family protein [Streptomyces sp. NBC_01092]|uniref:SseB family protein n=1 Tax=Streptomyces sp. NBC_01092 TaxID=2903748 RepID=UPI00386694E8|nr:SseB family protein [Streptomyces sp. NBC_01092]
MLIPVVGGLHYVHGHPQFVHLLLPVAERRGHDSVALVFTSEARMAQALREMHRYRPVILSELIAHWPLGGVALMVDAGPPDSLLLYPQQARRLLTRPRG